MHRYPGLIALTFMLVAGLLGCGGGGDSVDTDAGMPETAPQNATSGDVPTYTLDPSWPPALPNDWVMGVPTSVSVDFRDHVWVLHRPRTVPEDQQEHAAPAVLEFDGVGWPG